MNHRVVESIRRGQAEMQDRILADLIVERGLLSRAETAALTVEAPPGSLAERLVTEERVSPDQLEALSEEMDLLESLDTAVQDVTPMQVREAAREPDSRVGKYVLVDKLGAGGMGEVWRAWDYGLGRWVALKFLKVQNPKLIRRFMREATLLARLAHPNITQVYEIGTHEGRPFLTMELVDGGAFGGETLDRHEAAEVMRDAALGVAYAHEQGIVHRDLKPSNLLRSSSGRVFVTDFGLARMRSDEGGLTVSGALLGTPSFMAPEQAQGKDADERTDVYGLGATLYALVEGRPPFAGEAAADIVRQAATAPPPSLSGDRDDLTVVAQKAMERDRRDRYQTAQELADDLERYLADEPVLAQPISTLSRAWRKARRRPLYSSSVAAITALVVALGVWAGSQINDFRLRSKADGILEEIERFERDYRRYADAGTADTPVAGKLLEAMRPAIERAAEVAPDYSRTLLYRGRLLDWSGDHEAAEEVLGRLLDRDPTDHQARAARALSRLHLASSESGWEPHPEIVTWVGGIYYDYEEPPPEAARWIRAAREDYEALPDGDETKTLGVGSLAYYEGDYHACSERLGEMVAGDSSPLIARLRLIWCLLGTDEFELAEAHADVLISQRVFGFEATEKRALARAGQGRFEETIEDYLWLRSAYPERDTKLLPFWMSFVGRFDEALAEYERLLAESPDSVDLLLDRSVVYYRMERLDLALADADRAIELDPDNAEAHYSRAATLPPGEEALAAFDRAIELDPGNPLYRGQRAFVHLQLDDYEAAIADATFAVEREPDFRNWSWCLGLAHALDENWELGEKYLSRTVEMGMEDGFTFYWLGRARIQQEECAGVDDFARAAELGHEVDAESWELARRTCGADYVDSRRAAALPPAAE